LLIRYKVELQLNALVVDVFRNEKGLFELHYEVDGRKANLTAKSVVMASGGLPVQKLGASDFALRMAKKFGIEVTETAPGLVPLTITGKEADWFKALSGNSVFSKVST